MPEMCSTRRRTSRHLSPSARASSPSPALLLGLALLALALPTSASSSDASISGAAAASAAAAAAAASGSAPADPRPNFILILLDDLDATQGSAGELAMPATKRLLADQGVTLTNHFVTTPICCPSRVNLLTGRAAHNTNFTDVLGPHGGYAKFRALGLDKDWLPTRLQRAGYTTLYTGKFIVDYTIHNRRPAPAGWDAFDALVHPFTFEYYCPAFSLDGGEPRMYPAQYVTDVVGSKARALLRSAAAAARPFFLQVAPPAPHHSMHYDYNASGALLSHTWYPPVPAARHWELFSDAALPRGPAFNESDAGMAGRPVWMRRLASLTPGNATFLEEVYRLRLRALRAVDEMVEGLLAELSTLGLAGSTHVLLTSDNGYHQGAHRMGGGKTTAYEEDLRVPLLARGPGLPAGSTVTDTTLHIDLAPTVLALAGLPLTPDLDGTPLPLPLPRSAYPAPAEGRGPGRETTPEPHRNQFGSEFWGTWADETLHGPGHPPYRNHTWKAVRALRGDMGEAYKYVIHCTGEYELYDLARDPHELVNLLAPPPPGPPARQGVGSAAPGGGAGSSYRWFRSAMHPPAGAVLYGWARSAWARWAWAGAAAAGMPPPPQLTHGSAPSPAATSAAAAYGPAYGAWVARLARRLDALLAVLAVCGGRGCSRPWEVLHPEGGVADLWAAMHPRYDAMYDAVPPFAFGTCLPYQDTANEHSAFRGAAAAAAAAAVTDGLGTVQAPCGERRGGAASGTRTGTGTGCNTRAGGGDGNDNRYESSGGGGGGGDSQLAVRPPLPLVEADVEASSVPLPRKYGLIADLYGDTAGPDAGYLG